ncbi:uncharacterized protein LOC133535449 isoform X1 [Nerophis ophidion]|uniref:uncharacterized protein LOC133535449 isoform X1 n=2 Tax=Nerophis ophidion TaxID=159077 RepID=UPI002AE03ECA|nr:uncharacterized protein LOC133535449 isoform X1 [Nerophis ophidion]
MPFQLEAMSSRKRRPNWTDQECYLLAQLVHERKEVIRGKCISGLYDKRQAWEEITHTINTAFPLMQRTVSDCSKKWENLLAKSREEIKRQKMQAGADDDVSLDQLSALTQIAISVMNPAALQQDEDDSTPFDIIESQHNSGDKDGTFPTGEHLKSKHEQADPVLPGYASDPPGHKTTSYSTVPKSLGVQFSAHYPAASGEQSRSPCSPSAPAPHTSTLQDRMDLEMSVLRRQEAVLKLQEEYYTLKIKRMKAQMADSNLQD